jgi:hypothetical protein
VNDGALAAGEMKSMRRAFVATLLLSVSLAAQTSRPFRMATTAIQADPSRNPSYQSTFSATTLTAVASETDYISVFPEYLGIPYDEFATKTSPSSTHPWTVKMKALATQMKAGGKPIFLQLVLTRSTRTKNALNVNGSWALEPGSDPLCFDFSSPANAAIGTAYVNYVRWMRQQFSANYIVVAIEANLYYVHCGGDTPSWQALVQIERNAYDAVKFLNSSVVAFPSFKLEEMYRQDIYGFDDVQYQAMAPLKRDRFGIASYPFGLRRPDGTFINPYELPLDYFLRIQTKYPTEKKVVITETGWNSSGIAVGYEGNCYPDYIYSQEGFTRDYLLLILYSGYAGGFDMITWWSDRDLIQSALSNVCTTRATAPYYPECMDLWCVDINRLQDAQTLWNPAFSELVYKAFGTMGLRSYDGTPKTPVVDLWQRFYALPRL